MRCQGVALLQAGPVTSSREPLARRNTCPHVQLMPLAVLCLEEGRALLAFQILRTWELLSWLWTDDHP